MYRILTIDGGGIRGIIPATWLEKLEEDMGAPLVKFFDLIAGTSTGSILAAGISAGIPASDLVKTYVELGQKVFPPAGFSNRTNFLMDFLFKPKYPEGPLENLLKNHFATVGAKPIKLKDLNGNCMIVAYDVLNRVPKIFCSWEKDDRNINVWEACKGSCSAPTYFPAHILNFKGVNCPIIDGGVVANNPSSLALAHAIRLKKKQNLAGLEDSFDIFLVSLGTGNMTRPISIEKATEWGSAQWAMNVMDVLFDGTSTADEIACESILDESSYVRMQVELKLANEEMDDSTKKNINNLKNEAINYLEDEPGRYKYAKILQNLQK